MQNHAAHWNAGMCVFFVGWVLAMVHVGIAKYVIERLKERHGATWIGLGSPGIFINGNMRNAYLLWRFVTFGGHRVLGDDRLSAVCQADVYLQLVILPLFVVVLFMSPSATA